AGGSASRCPWPRPPTIEPRGETVAAARATAPRNLRASRGFASSACGLAVALELGAARGGAFREERAAADRTIKARPAPARREAALEAVEAAQAPAEVVDHVHERSLARARNDRAAVLERAVVGQDDVAERL